MKLSAHKSQFPGVCSFCGQSLRTTGPLEGSCGACDITADHVDRRKAANGDREAQKRVEIVKGARIRLGYNPDPLM